MTAQIPSASDISSPSPLTIRLSVRQSAFRLPLSDQPQLPHLRSNQRSFQIFSRLDAFKGSRGFKITKLSWKASVRWSPGGINWAGASFHEMKKLNVNTLAFFSRYFYILNVYVGHYFVAKFCLKYTSGRAPEWKIFRKKSSSASERWGSEERERGKGRVIVFGK